MKKGKFVFSMGILALIITTDLGAGELVYTPKNPSFGGSPLNGNWLQSQAQAQNTLTDPNRQLRSSQRRDPLQNFTESLSRQLLSRLSRQLLSRTFGEDGLEEGRHEFGNFVVEVFPGEDGVNVNITDTSNGNETGIVIPFL